MRNPPAENGFFVLFFFYTANLGHPLAPAMIQRGGSVRLTLRHSRRQKSTARVHRCRRLACMGVSKQIAVTVQPSTSSELPASRQYSLADAVSVILSDSPPENQFTADSDSGEEIDTRVESSFKPSDTTDTDPTVSLSPSCTGNFQLHCGWAGLASLGAGFL